MLWWWLLLLLCVMCETASLTIELNVTVQKYICTNNFDLGGSLFVRQKS